MNDKEYIAFLEKNVKEWQEDTKELNRFIDGLNEVISVLNETLRDIVSQSK